MLNPISSFLFFTVTLPQDHGELEEVHFEMALPLAHWKGRPQPSILETTVLTLATLMPFRNKNVVLPVVMRTTTLWLYDYFLS